jgi:hypothetical protein
MVEPLVQANLMVLVVEVQEDKEETLILELVDLVE